MKIEKVFWISANIPGVVGMVLGVDELTGEREGYIGIAVGSNEDTDKKYIAATGQKITPGILREVVDYLEPETDAVKQIRARLNAITCLDTERAREAALTSLIFDLKPKEEVRSDYKM